MSIINYDNHLGALDLHSLLVRIHRQVSSNWYRFGLALGVPEEIMKQLTDYSDKDALVELLDYWLNNHPSQPMWKEVDIALEEINCISVTNDLETQASACTLEFY